MVLFVGGAVEPMYERSVRQLVADLELTRWVGFTGTLPHAEVLSIMKAAVGCIVPSRFENPGRAPVEAMGLGAPLIVSDIPAFRDVCGDAPLYFKLGSAHELASQILLLLADEQQRGKVGAAGLQRMQALDFDSASRQILESLERLH
jgi:glycosyltransferase involved in cell wall biosynthesis